MSLVPNSLPFLPHVCLKFFLAHFKVFDDPIGMNYSILFPLHPLYFGRAHDRSPQPSEIETVGALFSSSDNIPIGCGFLPGWTGFRSHAASYAHPHFRLLLATEQERA